MIKSIKKWIGLMMNFFLLSCEEATLLMTKKKLTKLSFFKNLQLKLHLVSCELCKRFDIHNEMMHAEWNKFESLNTSLSDKKKKEIELQIRNETKS